MINDVFGTYGATRPDKIVGPKSNRVMPRPKGQAAPLADLTKLLDGLLCPDLNLNV